MELTVDGKYRLKKKIGSGTFGLIYLGKSGHTATVRVCVCVE